MNIDKIKNMEWQWLVVVGVRLIVPLTILRWSILGSVLAIVSDNLDVVMLDALNIPESGYLFYNQHDKFFDLYFSFLQAWVMLNWSNLLAKRLGMFLLIYRVIGTVWYELSGLRYLLFIFPNLFEFYFLTYVIYLKLFKKDMFANLKVGFGLLGLLLILKLYPEYILHILQFPIYQWIKNHFLFFI